MVVIRQIEVMYREEAVLVAPGGLEALGLTQDQPVTADMFYKIIRYNLAFAAEVIAKVAPLLPCVG